MVGFYAWLGDELSLYVRQLAWLNARPERRTVADKTEPRSRIEEMREAGKPLALPPNPAPYLVNWLMEIGPSVPGGMGESAIGYRDIAAFQEIAGVELMPWEAGIIRRLSRDFLNAASDARKADCPPPWAGDVDDIISRRAAVAAKVKAAFRMNLRGGG